MAIELPKLPYAKDALAPHISAETIEYHYGKHHKAYVDKVNAAIQGTSKASKSLEDLIEQAHGSDAGLFNNAAQVWNHTFYWNCLSPKGGGEPKGAAAKAIDESFGSFDSFRDKFSATAAGVFGSGWAWLVKDGDGVAIMATPNAGTPLTEGKTSVLTIDVWEHAYYIDYRNARPTYIEAFWKLVNWDFVNQCLGG